MKTNPYDPPIVDSTSDGQIAQTTPIGLAAVGALWAIAFSFPITAALGLLFRFPVPFGMGDENGIDHVIPSLFALLFYGIALGGFIVIGGTGALVGLITRLYVNETRSQKRYTRWIAGIATGILLLIFATIDWIIGLW